MLQPLCKFSIIAVSETWLDNDKISEVQIEGYELFTVNRQGKRGGGVALYVDSALHCRYIENKSIAMSNIFECVTVEIDFQTLKKLQVTCVYRTPGSSIDIFNEKIYELINLNSAKEIIVCGDFNINLLNSSVHSKTADFINMMYSNMLFPVISKPSRITLDTTTLIDNIFSNKIEVKIVGGLLTSDISDHLPVFAVFHSCLKSNNKTEAKYKFIRHQTAQSLVNFKQDLSEENWNQIYSMINPNDAYDTFLHRYIDLLNLNCPMKKVKVSNEYKTNPWLTKGLKKACKKKNQLYKMFVGLRTKEAENKYKKYKNKLVSIMRTCKRDYFHKLLEEQKQNIKGTWKVINTIIKGHKKPVTSTFFIEGNNKLETIK